MQNNIANCLYCFLNKKFIKRMNNYDRKKI